MPIFKPWNFGEEMSMDDKNIGWVGYIIFRNKITGKIALMISTTKLKLVKKILYLLPAKVSFNVKKITRDMASGYNWMLRELFPAAIQIADKFHVIKHALDALQDVRARYRQKFLTKRISPMKRKNSNTKKTDSRTEIPLWSFWQKARYPLFKFSNRWEDYQRERVAILFREFPEIKKAYDLICNFRNWMDRGNIGKDKKELIQEIDDWYKKTEDEDIEEVVNFKSLVERNFTFILNYFTEGDTNADAEGLNSQIQKFIHMNGGVRDRDFFHFRLRKYFS